MSRSKQPLSIEYAILGFLREQPLHGYEVYQRLRSADALGEIWAPRQSQFYALLSRLEADGYLASATEDRGADRLISPKSLPPRKLLALTPAGAAAFGVWLYTPTEPGDIEQREVLARLYFARQLGPIVLQQLLLGQRQQYRLWLQALRQALREHDAPHSYPWLVRQWQVRQAEAALDWLDTFGPPPPAISVAYPIAALADSPAAELARRFIAYVCGPAGQALLARHGFLPAGEAIDVPAADLRQPLRGDLVIFAASSLTDAFQSLGAAFESAHPQVALHFTFGGSQALADDLARGVPADVYAPAHQSAMETLIAAGRVAPGSSHTLAHNQLAIVTPAGRPALLWSLGDLARPGLRLALGSGATAVGRYTQEALASAERHGSLGPAGASAVLHNVAYYDETVTGVLTRVVQGEVDAGIVFTSDYHRASGGVEVAAVPPLG